MLLSTGILKKEKKIHVRQGGIHLYDNKLA